MSLVKILLLIAAIGIVIFALLQEKLLAGKLSEEFTSESVHAYCKKAVWGLIIFALGLFIEVLSKSNLTFWIGLAFVIIGAIISGRSSLLLEPNNH